MAEFPNFCNTIKEEPTSEEEGDDECELVACSALLHCTSIKEEPDSELQDEAHQGYESNELLPDFNDAATAALESTGFLQIIPGSVISLANLTRVTKGISETEMKNENTDAGSVMVQESDGYREYVVAYPPIPICVFKEETQSVDDQNECNSNQQLTIPMEGIALTGDTATTGLQSSMVTPSSSIRILRSYSKRSSTTITQKVAPDDGEISGKQMETNKMEKRSGRGIKEQQQVATAHSKTISEHSTSFEEVNAFGGVPSDEELDQIHPIAGPSRKRKQKANGKPSANTNLPKDKENDSASGNSTLPKKKRREKPLSLTLSHTEEKERPYRCDTCGRCYKQKYNLKRHLMGGECGIEMLQFFCEQCGDHFSRKDSLRRHLESIHKVERSQLAVFGAELIRSTKTGCPEEYPYKCSKCENVYKRKDVFTRHVKYECGVKPILCKDCNQQLKHKRSLKRHLLKIHKVNPSEFPSYGIVVKVRDGLRYKCETCGHSYSKNGSLRRHMDYECGKEASFLCPQCNFRTKHKFSLNQHLQYVHSAAFSHLKK